MAELLKMEYHSRVYTDRPPYADFDAPMKFQAIESIILKRLKEKGGEQMRDWMVVKRKEQRLTMKQVASAIGITEGYYSLIEKGERMAKLDIDFAKKIGDVFGMSIQEIADAEKGL